MSRSLEFRKVNSTNLTHLGGISCIVISTLLFYSTIYHPMHSEQLDQRHRIEQLTKLISELRAAKAQSSLREKELELLTKRVASVRERIPEASNEAEMLRQLSTIAADSKFVVSDYRRGQFNAEGIHARFEIGILGQGNYSSICKFLDGVYHLPRVNRIERLEIRTESESDNYPVNLTISVFYGGSVAKT